MALYELPALKPVEVRMSIINDGNRDAFSRADYRNMRGPLLREVWRLDMALAPMLPGDGRALERALERADGRAHSLQVPFAAGVHTKASAATVSLAQDAERGAGALVLDIADADLLAGTLIAVGTITEAAYQVFEILDDAAAGSSVQVNVAPRCRYAFTTSAAVAVGANAVGRFRLAGDDEGAPSYAVNGAAFLNLSLVEVP